MSRTAVACLMLILAGCSSQSSEPSKPSATPTPATVTPTPAKAASERAVDMLMRALEDGNCERVRSIVVTPSAIDCPQVGEAAGLLGAEGVDLDAVKYEAGEVAGDSTTVTITWGKDRPPEQIDVQRVDGTWLVVFDSSP